MILNIYKERDWTSFDVVAKVKGLLRASGVKKPKVGHAGTLDPLAEGVLVILVGDDTKQQDRIMQLKKEYICEIAFGAESKTYDLEGDLTYNTLPEGFNLKKLNLKKFMGEIEQTVPAFSAVKVAGKRLYKSARKGDIDVSKLPTRTVNIYEIEVLEYKKYKDLPALKLRVACSKGTYIRSLVHDFGQELGVGAVLTHLVRSKVGDYEVADSTKISDLKV